ncbi:MAG TPA: DUF4339 domain-containing protein [Thermoguttaceae bacterium]|nr:DUF4339 domain-containing protein [Thermoguttaceae bacterium]
MESGWYLKVANKEVGPLAPRQLKAMADKGQISPYDPVRLGSDGRWVPASSVRGLLPAGGPSVEQPPPSRLPVAEQLERPPAASGGRPDGETKPAAEARLATGTKPAAAPTASLPGTAQPGIPVAQAVGATPAPPASAASLPGPFAIETGQDILMARYAGRQQGSATGSRRRRKKEAVIVGGIMVLMALAAVTAAVILSGKGATTASKAPKAADKASQDVEAEHEEVVIPGLDEYLGGTGPESPGSSPSESSAADAWTDASTSSVECGEVVVKIASAQIARPRLTSQASGKAARGTEDYLCLKLELWNKGKSDRREYRSWNVVGAGVTLVDDQDKRYSLESFVDQRSGLDGETEGGAVLSPGGVAVDMLVFERPAKSAALLRLQLPARAFGEQGSLKFQIPISMIAVAHASQESGLGEASDSAAERAAGRRGAQKAGEAQATASAHDGGPIPIPGVTNEPSSDGESGSGFAADPKLP